jgi:sugar lactone lactonase YvrE
VARGTSACDSGAFEGIAAAPTATPTPTNTATPTSTATPTATATPQTLNVTTCDESTLRSTVANALANATVRFGCSGTITLTASDGPITVAKNLTLDGNGQVVTISGGNAVGLFVVNTGVSFTARTLTLAKGSSNNGGAIYNGGGTVSVATSTFSGNSANVASLGIFSTDGGAIYNGGGTVSVANSTFSGNSASFSPGNGDSGYGGAIFNLGSLSVANSTFSGNAASQGGSGIEFWTGAVTLANDILANAGSNCDVTVGSIQDAGGNVEDGTGCGFTSASSLSNTNPLLGPLAGNGGPTWTMGLYAGSPALGRGVAATCGAAPVSGVDQRGVARGTSACDSGAFEGTVAAPTATPTDTATATPTQTNTDIPTDTPAATDVPPATDTPTDTPASGGGAQTTIAGGLQYPLGLAVDGAGNLYIADTGNNRVLEVPPGGSPQSIGASGLNNPAGLAVDRMGNLYIADVGNNRVVELPSGGGTPRTVGTGLSTPIGLAVDGAGNLYIADTGNNRVVEVPAGGGPQTTVASGLFSPQGLAVDGQGTLYIVDSGNNRLVKLPGGGATPTTVDLGGDVLNSPIGVAVDGAGTLYIADAGNNQVVDVPAGGGTPTTVGSGWIIPAAVAVDGAGNLYVADADSVQELLFALPPAGTPTAANAAGTPTATNPISTLTATSVASTAVPRADAPTGTPVPPTRTPVLPTNTAAPSGDIVPVPPTNTSAPSGGTLLGPAISTATSTPTVLATSTRRATSTPLLGLAGPAAPPCRPRASGLGRLRVAFTPARLLHGGQAVQASGTVSPGTCLTLRLEVILPPQRRAGRGLQAAPRASAVVRGAPDRRGHFTLRLPLHYLPAGEVVVTLRLEVQGARGRQQVSRQLSLVH